MMSWNEKSRQGTINKFALRDKRADFSIALLVFLTFVMCGIALFTFLQYRGMNGKNMIDVGYAYQNYFREDYAKYYLISASKEILKNKKIDAEGFKTQLKARIRAIDDDVLDGVKEKMNNNDFSISLDSNKLIFEMNRVLFSIARKNKEVDRDAFQKIVNNFEVKVGWKVNDVTGNSVVNYWADIKFEILR